MIIKIADALLALVNAVEGVDGVNANVFESGYKAVQFNVKTDADVHRLAALVGAEVKPVTLEGRATWLVARKWCDDHTSIEISGPHHQIAEMPEIDSSKVESALALAAEAVS